MNEPTGFFVGSPTELPLYEIVQWVFEHQYGKIDGCARSKCYGSLCAIFPPNCTPVYNTKEEKDGIREM